MITTTETGIQAGCCSKCGHPYTELRYMSPGHLAEDGSIRNVVDSLWATCIRCGYSWHIAPLDRKEE